MFSGKVRVFMKGGKRDCELLISIDQGAGMPFLGLQSATLVHNIYNGPTGSTGIFQSPLKIDVVHLSLLQVWQKVG